MHRDARGVPVSGGSAFARDQFEVALRQFQSYVGDPVATLDAALADSPQFVVGHLFRALAMFTMTEKSLRFCASPPHRPAWSRRRVLPVRAGYWRSGASHRS